MPYKNVETLLAGMAFLPDYRLHLVSQISSAREAELSERIPSNAEVVFWRGIPDADYERLLAGAAATVTASRDEGFGLPVIEAMHAGTPVVCSALAIFREVTGGHAEFFDAGSPEDFAAAVRALEDPHHRAETVTEARCQAGGFTWHASAERLLALMRSLTAEAR